MKDSQTFTVLIQGVGTVLVLAETKWHAIDKAYTQHMHVQPKRKKYKIKFTKLVKS